MRIVLYETTKGEEVTIKSGSQKAWSLLSRWEQELVRTLLSHDDGKLYDGKTIKMGSTIATVRL
tara:strand:+ start:326 stop:517 length:192 start_codon:yes stop_codon:yes gene_type:complete